MKLLRTDDGMWGCDRENGGSDTEWFDNYSDCYRIGLSGPNPWSWDEFLKAMSDMGYKQTDTAHFGLNGTYMFSVKAKREVEFAWSF